MGLKAIDILRLKSINDTTETNEEGEELFKRLIHLEKNIDYNKLLYTSSNKEKIGLKEADFKAKKVRCSDNKADE